MTKKLKKFVIKSFKVLLEDDSNSQSSSASVNVHFMMYIKYESQ